MEEDSKGCLVLLGAFLLFLAGCLVYNIYNHSYTHLMSEARGSGDVQKYVLAIDNNPEDDVTEALDSIVRLCKPEDFNTISNMYNSYGERYAQINQLMSESCDDLYAKTKKINTLDTWQRYKDLVPEKYKRDADVQIEKATIREYHQEYLKASQKNTIDGWSSFIGKVPEKYQKDAQRRLDILKKRIWNNEASAWKEVCRTSSIDDYYKYLKLYPHGRHHQEAIDAEVAAVLHTRHGEMPEMDQVGESDGVSIITVTNRTAYTLRIFYSGPCSKQLEIPANGIRQIALTDGKYGVSARVDADVQPYGGYEDIRGEYEVEYYISSTTFQSRYSY
jgi:hypothetical protein